MIDGAGACPPEDVGGPPGYIELLDTTASGACLRSTIFEELNSCLPTKKVENALKLSINPKSWVENG